MALSPYNITALEEDFATAQGTGKNIVAGALVTLATTGGTPVLMADNAAGANPSLTKFTDSIGQLVIWVDVDVYDLTVDGGAAIRISVPRADTGTASTADLTTSSTDTTAGRVTKVDDFGLGGVTTLCPNNDPFQIVTNGFYHVNIGAPNVPDDTSGGHTIVSAGVDSTNRQLMFLSRTTNEMFTNRQVNGTWQGWVGYWNESNLIHLQNTSGGTVASNSTVAGSGLTPTQAGTWRNVSGGDILNNGYGLWGLV